MAEPTSSSAAIAAGSVGLMALLIGAVGPVAADVMMVIISALAGCFVALSSVKDHTIKGDIWFTLKGVILALVLAWSLAGVVSSMFPILAGPYCPSVIAMFIGFINNRMGDIMNSVLDRYVLKLFPTVEQKKDTKE